MEDRGCEETSVEADDGDLDTGAEYEVGELVCEEDLGGVRFGVFGYWIVAVYIPSSSSSGFREIDPRYELHCLQLHTLVIDVSIEWNYNLVHGRGNHIQRINSTNMATRSTMDIMLR